MELSEWVGILFALTPVWVGLVYGILRLTKRVGPPEGLPPGRVGGMSRQSMSGGPWTDAPAYAQKLKREAEAEAEARGSEGPGER